MSKQVSVRFNAPAEDREHLQRIAADAGITMTELLHRMMAQVFDTGIAPGFDKGRDEDIAKAAGLVGISYNQFRDQAAKTAAKTLVGNESRLESGDNVRGSAAVRVNKGIDAIMEHNDRCENWYGKLEISASILSKKPGKIASGKEHPLGVGSNRGAIKAALEARKAEIEAHYNKHDIKIGHSSKAYIERKQLGIVD